MNQKIQVGVVMGSNSDWETMRHAVEILQQFGIAHEARVVSEHAAARDAVLWAARAGRTWVRSYWLDNAFLLGDPGQVLSRAEGAEDLDVLLRTVRDCLPGKPYFEFFGGEPLLYSGIWDVIRLIRQGGCEAYISKPISVTHFLDTIRRLLN